MQGEMGDQGPAGAVVSLICGYFLMLILDFLGGWVGEDLSFFFLIYVFSNPFDCTTHYFY